MDLRYFLSKDGLTYFAGLIKTALEAKLDSSEIDNYYTKSEIDSMLSSRAGGVYKVESLPATGVEGGIYLIAISGSGDNMYKEYIYTDGGYELLGTADLSDGDYLTSNDLEAIDDQTLENMWTYGS